MAQNNEINALSTQLAHQGNAIVLRDTKITDLEAIVKALQERSGADKELMQAKNDRLKIRLMKTRRSAVIGWGVAIVAGAIAIRSMD